MNDIDEAHSNGIAVGQLRMLMWMRQQLSESIRNTGRYEGVAELHSLLTAVDDKIREVQTP